MKSKVIISNKRKSLFLFAYDHMANTRFTNPGMKERRKEIFCLTTHSTHFIYGYMASDR